MSTRAHPRHRRPATALAISAIALGAGAARADDRDDRIRELERQVEAQAVEQARLREEMNALKGDRAADTEPGALRAAVEAILRDDPAAAGGATTYRRPRASLDLGGYFSTRFANSELPGEKPSFQDMRFVLQIRSEISEHVRFDGELEFEHGGVSDEAGGEVKVEYGEVLLSESDAFALKAGSLRIPWGRFNREHDDPLNELSSRPTVSRFVQGVVFAGPGIGVEGSVAVGDETTFHYDLTLTNGLADDFGSDEGIREARTLWEDDDNHDKTVFGRVGLTPTVSFVDALDVGASFGIGRLGEKADDEMRAFGFDAVAKAGPWEFRAEWAHVGVDRDDGAPSIDAVGNLGPIRGMHGYYAQVLYRIRESWVRGLPFADDSASVGLVLRRDAVDLNDRVRGAAPEDDERAWTFGVNYRPTTKTVLKFEYRMASSAFPGDEGDDRDLFVFEFATYF